MEDGARSDRYLLLALSAQVQISGARPVFRVAAGRKDKSFWPAKLEQVITARPLTIEATVKFDFIFREIFEHFSLLAAFGGHSSQAQRQILSWHWRLVHNQIGIFHIHVQRESYSWSGKALGYRDHIAAKTIRP